MLAKFAFDKMDVLSNLLETMCYDKEFICHNDIITGFGFG